MRGRPERRPGGDRGPHEPPETTAGACWVAVGATACDCDCDDPAVPEADVPVEAEPELGVVPAEAPLDVAVVR
jgi:hypothetical protein